MEAEKAIHSKRVLLPDGIRDVTLLIGNGTILSIEPGKWSAPKGFPFIEAGESLIMPGLIDSHVHINEPGRTDWEGFESMTKAAAAGGITTLVDMPLNSSPVTTNTKALQAKLDAAKGKLMVNVGCYGGIVPGNSDQLEALAKAGVLGFKVFLTHSGIDEFPETSMKELDRVAPSLAKLGLPLLAHAELDNSHPGQAELEDDHYSYNAYLHSRPNNWEDEAVRQLIALCEKHKVRTHIVHLSSASALPMIREARAKGLPLTAETCPHYVYFSSEKIPDADTRFKCAPPIRDAANNQLLWDALTDHTLDFIVTDHSPAPPETKELDSGDLKAAWGGIASIQFSLPVVWTLAKQRKNTLEEVAAWMSTRVADFLGLPKKGRIQVGADADLVIWSPDKKMKINRNNIQFRHKVTPYEGEMVFGVVEQTWVNGELAYDRGGFVSSPPGKILLHQA